MSDQEYEQMLKRVLNHDYSIGTEAFRDELLGRCLATLGSDEHAAEISDEALELVSAAGDVIALDMPAPFGNNVII